MSINLSDFGSQENLQIFRAENSLNFLASQKPKTRKVFMILNSSSLNKFNGDCSLVAKCKVVVLESGVRFSPFALNIKNRTWS